MHKPFEEYPRNSPENVLEVVESKIEGKYGEAMPELLSEFIKLLGNETEEWGGVKAMKKCVEDFLSWKKKFPVLKDPTWQDFQTFLFCPSRSVIVIQVSPDSLILFDKLLYIICYFISAYLILQEAEQLISYICSIFWVSEQGKIHVLVLCDIRRWGKVQ